MSVDPNVLAQIVASGKPVLCIDTCSLLDVMRDVTRDTVLPDNIAAANDLLDAAEGPAPRLWVLIAQQVRAELVEHEQPVRADAEKSLQRFRANAARIDRVAGLFGAAGVTDTSHWAGHVASAASIYDRWKRVGHDVNPASAVIHKAFNRVSKGHAPSIKGKQSMKDCVIVESYLAAMRDLRNAGFQAKAVVLSSNTNDYWDSATRSARAPLEVDFSGVQMEYARDHRYAKHLLGV